MLKEAIEKLVELGKPITLERENGDLLTNANLKKYEEPLDLQYAHDVYSINALLNLIKDEAAIKYPDRKIFIEINDYNRILCYLNVIDKERNSRVMLYRATETDVAGVPGGWLDYQTAMIKLKAQFQDTPDKDYLIKLLSKIDVENGVHTEDNGMSQSVTVRTGIAAKGIENVKSICNLKPYRTFMEVEQPASDFLIRISDNQEIQFIEADGGMWKLAAKQTIKAYIETALKDYIEDGQVVVML